MSDLSKWDMRFLERAEAIAKWSKDPNTQVGAVIVNAQRHEISSGYNGFSAGIADAPERFEDKDAKNDVMIHAEMNAILHAGRDLANTTIYVWPYAPCVRCAVHIIQAGIRRVVSLSPDRKSSWYDSQMFALRLFEEARVEYFYLRPGTEYPIYDGEKVENKPLQTGWRPW
jgi:dCMP deaminase